MTSQWLLGIYTCALCTAPGSSHIATSFCTGVGLLTLVLACFFNPRGSQVLWTQLEAPSLREGARASPCRQGLLSLSSEQDDEEKSCCYRNCRSGLWLSWGYTKIRRIERVSLGLWAISHRLGMKISVQVPVYQPVMLCVFESGASSLGHMSFWWQRQDLNTSPNFRFLGVPLPRHFTETWCVFGVTKSRLSFPFELVPFASQGALRKRVLFQSLLVGGLP